MNSLVLFHSLPCSLQGVYHTEYLISCSTSYHLLLLLYCTTTTAAPRLSYTPGTRVPDTRYDNVLVYSHVLVLLSSIVLLRTPGCRTYHMVLFLKCNCYCCCYTANANALLLLQSARMDGERLKLIEAGKTHTTVIVNTHREFTY